MLATDSAASGCVAFLDDDIMSKCLEFIAGVASLERVRFWNDARTLECRESTVSSKVLKQLHMHIESSSLAQAKACSMKERPE